VRKNCTLSALQVNVKRKNSALMWAITLLPICWLMLLAQAPNVSGQTLRARISVVSLEPARINLEIELPVATDSLSFRNAYGGVLGLGERIELLEGVRDGASRRIQPSAPGEFRSANKFSRYRYVVSVAGPSQATEMSHVSWLNKDQGLLMLADLLPQVTSDSLKFSSARITIEMPAGWTISSNARRESTEFSTDDPENAVFLVGPHVVEKSESSPGNRMTIIASGKWPFANKDAFKIAQRIIREYSGITAFALQRDAVVMLVPYPENAGPESWSAETRGNVVVLLLGRKASRKTVLSRLGIVLSHELFHLWVPNSLQLTGAYDWFFEGFTLYQALLMDLRLGFISFDEYLRTLASVYDAYLSAPDHERLSLLAASERRWTTASSLVYNQGMLVAFLFDLSLRSRTDCQSSIENLYLRLFKAKRTGQENANETIIKLLTEREGFADFAHTYVENAGEIDLDKAISEYGLKVQRSSSGTRLVVGQGLTDEQRQVLRCLGYRR
jgi:hypothetical protein